MNDDRLDQLNNELQGNILRPYLGAHCARMYLVRFTGTDLAARRAWLRSLLRQVSIGVCDERGESSFVNVAFGVDGLRAFDLDPTEIAAFPAAFREGMSARGVRLGDPAVDDDCKWTTGRNPGRRAVDALVLVHAVPGERVTRLLTGLGAAARDACGVARNGAAAGASTGQYTGERADFECLSELLDRTVEGLLGREFFADPELDVMVQDLHTLLDEHGQAVEYFGFRDGISQPEVVGADGKALPLLDHFVTRAGSPLHANGSYLVVRQLEQDVERFWKQMEEKRPDQLTAQALAERVVGRRMNGERLDGKKGSSHAFDPVDGEKGCPFHSHTRRLNPQVSSSPDANPRLIRRSISYAENGKRGLMFMAYNADIEQQFEFIQRNWLQRGNHVGLSSHHADPFGGFSLAASPAARDAAKNPDPNFVVEGEGISLELSSAISYRGGGYFFVPSRTALERIAGVAPAPEAGRLPQAAEAEYASRSVPSNDPVALELAACGSDAKRLELIQEWIDGPRTGPSFWRYVREREHAGAPLRVDKVVFIANPELVEEVLIDGDSRFSVEQYGQRMRATFGNFMLGMDKPAHDLEYRATKLIPSANLYGRFRRPAQPERLREVQRMARSLADRMLSSREQQAKLGGTKKLPEVRLRDLIAFVLGEVAARYFGISDLSAGTLLSWSGDIARRHFRFQTDKIDEMKAREAASLLMAHVLSLIAKARELQREGTIRTKGADDPAVILLNVLQEIKDGLERPVGDDVAPSLASGHANDHDLARNLIGIALGSMVATAKAVGEGFSFFAARHLKQGTSVVWPGGADLLSDASDPTAGDSLFAQIIERSLHAAARGSLDSVYRTYRGDQPWTRGTLTINDGDTVVVWLGGTDKTAAVDPLFGAGIHKCPGMDMAKAIMNGTFQALAQASVSPRLDDEEQLVLSFRRGAKPQGQHAPGVAEELHAAGIEDRPRLAN
jgi:Dyp-type peroxidase family